MAAEQLNELESSMFEALEVPIRGCRESGVGLIALGIGIIVCRIPGSSCRRSGSRRCADGLPVLRAAGRVAGRHVAALGQLIGRLLAAVVFG